MIPMPRKGSATWNDIYGVQDPSDTTPTDPASGVALPAAPLHTYPIATVPEGSVVPVPFTIDASAQSLIIVNPNKAAMFLAFDRTAPTPTWADRDAIVPARSLMTIPVLRNQLGRTLNAIAVMGTPVGEATDAGDPLVHNNGSAIIYASELALPATISPMIENAGDTATESTLKDVLTALQTGSGGQNDTIVTEAHNVPDVAGDSAPLVADNGQTSLAFQNRGAASVWLGADGIAAPADGWELKAGAVMVIPTTGVVGMISDAGTVNNVRVMQLINSAAS